MEAEVQTILQLSDVIVFIKNGEGWNVSAAE